jgi:hypothetical protein
MHVYLSPPSPTVQSPSMRHSKPCYRLRLCWDRADNAVEPVVRAGGCACSGAESTCPGPCVSPLARHPKLKPRLCTFHRHERAQSRMQAAGGGIVAVEDEGKGSCACCCSRSKDVHGPQTETECKASRQDAENLGCIPSRLETENAHSSHNCVEYTALVQ